MNSWTHACIVAGWEFRRFFKWKDQLRGILISVVTGGLAYTVVTLVMRDTPQDTRIAVLQSEQLDITLAEDTTLILEPAIETSAALTAAVGAGTLDGLLTIHDPDDVELLVFKEPPWLGELEGAVSAAQVARRMAAANLTPEQLAAITTTGALRVQIHAAGKQPSTRGEKIAAGILIGLMMMGIFHAMALFMTAVTGEKQLRVTEQIVAAVPAQTWIDGKLLGLTAATIGYLASLVVSILVFAVLWQSWSSGLWQLPQLVLDPLLVLTFAVMTGLGLLFWNCFFAAVAVTINDPNTSARSAVLILPILPVGLCFFSLAAPDSQTLQVLSWIPGFSSALLPARLVLTQVSGWEIALAVAALIAAVWFVRRLAGRIFEAAILTYGQEPSWKQMWHWVRAR